MPLAEIHRMAPKAVRESEDFLTSGAFGLMTLLPPELCLVPWLRYACRYDKTALVIPGPVEVVEAAFWPTLDQDPTVACTPDLLLACQTPDGDWHGLLVEVKYRSGPSGWPVPPEDSPKLRGQLSRQWAALLSLPDHRFPGQPKRVSSRGLVYVTAETSFPGEIIERFAVEIGEKGGARSAFLLGCCWLSWFYLSDVIRKKLSDPNLPGLEKLGLRRLFDFLDRRRLTAFSGVARPVPLSPLPWTYTAPHVGYPSPPLPMPAIHWTYRSGG